jgi:hypothetical protein
MANIFEDMAKVSAELLQPASTGQFGADSINLIKILASPPPANEWDPPTAPITVVTPLAAQAFGVSAKLVGTEVAPGVTIMASDKRVIAAPFPGGASPEDQIQIDGKLFTILQVENVVGAGAPSLIKFLIRG